MRLRTIIEFTKIEIGINFLVRITAKSIVIEASELLECFQWNNNYNKDEVCEELADVVNCVLLAKLDVDLRYCLKKLDKTNKYPVNKCRGKSNKYNKLG